jgi:hypothetical protein
MKKLNAEGGSVKVLFNYQDGRRFISSADL